MSTMVLYPGMGFFCLLESTHSWTFVLEVGLWSTARSHSSLVTCRLSPIFCLSLEFIGHGRVLHARELVGDSVEDMLVLLTSDAFHPIAESESGDLANLGDGV